LVRFANTSGSFATSLQPHHLSAHQWQHAFETDIGRQTGVAGVNTTSASWRETLLIGNSR
jgi:hypothetical protein